MARNILFSIGVIGLVCTVGISAFGQNTEPSVLNHLFEKIDEIESKVYEEFSVDSKNGMLGMGVEWQIKLAEEWKKVLPQAEQIRPLNRSEEISKSVLVLELKNRISNVEFKQYLVPFNAEGGFYNSPVDQINRRSFRTKEDYANYVKWLESTPMYVDYYIDLLKKGIKENVMQPVVIVNNAIKMTATLTLEPELNPFYAPFKKLPDHFSPSEEIEVLKLGIQTMEKKVIPQWKKLLKFWENDYLKSCPTEPGASKMANGKAYYEDRIQFFTTLDITPDSVFNLGMSEVNRIKLQMQLIIDQLEFKGDFADFIRFLRSDDQFYAKTPQELLSRAAWLSKKSEGQLPRLFSHLYELPFTVEPVPDQIAPTYTGGRYVPGSRSRNRAGIYWVNTYNLPARPFYTLPALTLHEAVPGHHLNMMVAAELTDVPDFRKNYYISAFGEGWGLYAEYLGEEMGMYETPYDLFGRYTYEMWRACRLVVDVGIHYKGWSRQQAVDFLASNTALSLHEVNTEIDRYIGWPGQAVSYKIGELTIKALRKQAEESLGTKMDIQEFHHVVLRNGSIPLSELRKEVEAFIEREK